MEKERAIGNEYKKQTIDLGTRCCLWGKIFVGTRLFLEKIFHSNEEKSLRGPDRAFSMCMKQFSFLSKMEVMKEDGAVRGLYRGNLLGLEMELVKVGGKRG